MIACSAADKEAGKGQSQESKKAQEVAQKEFADPTARAQRAKERHDSHVAVQTQRHQHAVMNHEASAHKAAIISA